MDYNLNGLSSRSFEKLVQSVAAQVLGPGIVIFGDGPDGGREATFDGTVPFPSAAEPWTGYGIVQAKFLQRSHDVQTDTRWLTTQLESELKRLARRSSRWPDFYILATNVTLSSVSGTGGKDRVARILSRTRSSKKFRAWRVWDYDQLARFLDAYEGIRTAYGPWITSGDVLAAAMARLTSSRSDFDAVMTTFLAKELLHDQFANLDQAGHATEDKVPLAQVFVDLPVTSQRSSDPPRESPSTRPLGFANHVLQAAKDRWDPSSAEEGSRNERASPGASPVFAHVGRAVLFGGPGQGKTTLSQFVCQLFRVALLKDRPKGRLSPEVRTALVDLVEQSKALDLEIPAARRFPIRVVLNEFAKAISAAGPDGVSLLQYIVRLIRRRTDTSITADDLRQWLASYPWLLVLDGLDEVPPSTNRTAVLEAIRAFAIDASQAGADLLTIVTTRPQGYTNEFDSQLYQQLWLAPLSRTRALAYAERFVAVRYSGDEERQRKITTRLKHAIKQDATARLLRSPLLVTLMTTLVDQLGRPPEDRWRLFHDYYEVIYRREMERGIPAADLLREHRVNLDTIHSQVGLILQIESERTGGTEARLSAARFRDVVVRRLEEEGYVGTAREDLALRIIDAAANRLVFLVGVEEGSVGFEIRSLQEFMAAEALMAGPEGSISQRLRRVASAASWRNAFLFAAGRCFADRQHLRDTIFTIASELNDHLAGPLGATVRAGSVLALDLLDDGLARRAPRFARLFARLALELLDSPPSDLHQRLAEACIPDVDQLFEEELTRRIAGPSSPLERGAWATAIALIGRNVEWARLLAETYWPKEAQEQLVIANGPIANGSLEWLGDRVIRAAEASPPGRSWHIVSLAARQRARRKVRDVVTAVWHPSRGRSERVHLRLEGMQGSWAVMVGSIRATLERTLGLNVDAALHPHWTPAVEGMRLARSPSSKLLAQALEKCAHKGVTDPGIGWSLCPWFLTSLLKRSASPEDLLGYADLVRAGRLGEGKDWLTAEQRWLSHGIESVDLMYEPEQGLPFDDRIASVGCPAEAIHGHSIGSGGSPDDLVAGITAYKRLRLDSPWRTTLADVILSALQWDDEFVRPDLLTPDLLLDMVHRSDLIYVEPFVALLADVKDPAAWTGVCDAVGMQRQFFVDALGKTQRSMEEGAGVLAEMAVANPALTGVQRLLANLLDRVNKESLERVAKTAVAPPSRTDDLFVADAIAKVSMRLALGSVSISQTHELASATLTAQRMDQAQRTDQASSVIDEVLQNLRRADAQGDAYESYLLDLHRLLSSADVDERSALLLAMTNVLRRRASGLGDVSVWRQLELPTELMPLACATDR